MKALKWKVEARLYPPIGRTIPSLRRISRDMAKDTVVRVLLASPSTCWWWQQAVPACQESRRSRLCSEHMDQSVKVVLLER